jgi:hypothetical protein
MAKPRASKVQTLLKVNNINVRMEMAGREEKGNLAVDIALTGSVHLEQIGQLIDDDHLNALLGHLYDADGNLISPSIEKLQLGTEIKDCKVHLGEGANRISLKDSKLDSICLTPMPGRQFDFAARVQTHPTAKDQATLEFDLLKTVVKVIVDGGERINERADQAEMPLDGKSGEGGSEPVEEEAEA